MMRNKGIAETQITWKINSGNSSFWWDDWLGEGPLASYCTHVTSLNTTEISQFRLGGTWNETMIPDEAIWKLTVDGLFSCSSAWEIIRHKGPKSIINKGIWHRHLPFKISFLAWRALRNKLPTNEKITSFGKEAARCSCCYRTGEDNIDHIFVSGHFANNIWSFFSAAAGKENVVADALSRRYVLISTLTSKLLGFDQIKFLYANDSDFGEIFAE
ncbi:hypothetical protein MTR67_039016 [Solanum verrucosum]|uniref:Reverse transcriptase zinc-binding domain-containing protein n=1 Tax=Solanum verrucosum TaxID=315347 RepID=A0AAF0ZNF1_SOLVR|nr:hypothetical protein MTR67_039016 [Solanum verrucosum]